MTIPNVPLPAFVVATCATPGLKTGEHPKVVADRLRLSHRTTNVALNIYCDVVKGMQPQAAEKHGGSNLRAEGVGAESQASYER